MKILCPTDFSSAGNSGVEYAAHIAREMNAALTLIYVQPLHVTEGVNMFAFGELPSAVESREVGKKLDDLSRDIREQFSVPCSYTIDYSFATFEKKVSASSKKYDLIISGTNGTETLYQFYTGSHSYKLAKDAACPVLIVPEGCNYEKIERVAYASSYHKSDDMLLDQLKTFIDLFKPELHIVHVSLNESLADRELFSAFCRQTEETLKYNAGINFKRITDEDACGAIINYLNHAKINVLILCMEKHDVIYRLFHEDLIKKMAAYESGYPILIVHK